MPILAILAVISGTKSAKNRIKNPHFHLGTQSPRSRGTPGDPSGPPSLWFTPSQVLQTLEQKSGVNILKQKAAPSHQRRGQRQI